MSAKILSNAIRIIAYLFVVKSATLLSLLDNLMTWVIDGLVFKWEVILCLDHLMKYGIKKHRVHRTVIEFRLVWETYLLHVLVGMDCV